MQHIEPVITSQIAWHVLWQYDRGGVQPGQFTQRLMEAIDAADMHNVGILQGSYPELVAAMMAAKNDPDGIARLQRIAGQAAA